MNKAISLFKGFVFIGFVMAVIGITSVSAQTVTTFASGFGQVGDIAFDSSGNMYLTARMQNKIMKVTLAGVVSTDAGDKHLKKPLIDFGF